MSIDSGDGDDTISNHGNLLTINSGDGDDSIDSSGDSVTINSGSGDDLIHNSWSNSVTIDAGAGDDVINLSDESGSDILIKYNLGDGNDTIIGIKSNDIVQITSGSYTTTASGNDVILKIGTGNITLKDSVNMKLLIKNADDHLDTLNADKGIYISSISSDVKLSGSNYDDSISNYGSSVNIDGGIGNDIIYNCGTLATISGGIGDDSIALWYYSEDNNNLIKYNLGDGNDIVTGIKSNDTVQITSGSYTTTASGNDVILKIGTGSITLENSNDIRLLIKNADGHLDTLNADKTARISNASSNVTLSGSSYNDDISRVCW